MLAPNNILKDLSLSNREILDNEYKTFLDKIDKDSYYVYILYGLGEPFYVGKGKNLRAYSHLKNCNGTSYKDRYIRYLYSINEPPVVFIVKNKISELEAFELEKDIIKSKGRVVTHDGPLLNIMSGHIPEKELDKELKRAGGLALNLTGTRGGCFSKEWRENNKEKVKENAKHAGKISWHKIQNDRKEEHKKWSSKGGKITGKMLFWTKGDETTRSHTCPGPGWIRGNSNFNKNSIAHAKLPSWTNGYENKRSKDKPGDDFFNGITQFNLKDNPKQKKVIVFTKQIGFNTIPECYNYGCNYINKEED